MLLNNNVAGYDRMSPWKNNNKKEHTLAYHKSRVNCVIIEKSFSQPNLITCLSTNPNHKTLLRTAMFIEPPTRLMLRIINTLESH